MICRIEKEVGSRSFFCTSVPAGLEDLTLDVVILAIESAMITADNNHVELSEKQKSLALGKRVADNSFHEPESGKSSGLG